MAGVQVPVLPVLCLEYHVPGVVGVYLDFAGLHSQPPPRSRTLKVIVYGPSLTSSYENNEIGQGKFSVQGHLL